MEQRRKSPRSCKIYGEEQRENNVAFLASPVFSSG